MLPLVCATKEYAWGKKGKSSYVSNFIEKIGDKTPYAELWMGTHSKGECSVVVPDEKNLVTLSKYLSTLKKDKLGTNTIFEQLNYKVSSLPFLFKILSVSQALSIQVHPTREWAKKLREEEKDNKVKHYADDNHKPELAIALTEFEALCGFRDIKEIEGYINSVVELKELLFGKGDKKVVMKSLDELKGIFKKFVEDVNQKDVVAALEKTVKRLKGKKNLEDLEKVFLRIYEKYPIDRCCYCVYIFNYYVLKPGESLFISACVPHCYLLGDCMECMSNSDNVIRAGLTPKHRDTKNLLKMLKFEKEENMLKPKKFENFDHVLEFQKKEFNEFKVLQVKLKSGEKVDKMTLKNISVLIVVKGGGKINGKTVMLGNVFFVHANHALTIECYEEILIYIGTVNC